MAGRIKKSLVLSVAIVFVGSSLASAGGITTFQRPRAQSGRYKSRTHSTSPVAKMQSHNSSIVEDAPPTPGDEAPKTKTTSKSAKTGDKPASGVNEKTAMKATDSRSN
jgi:hypothetical protein